MNRRAVVFVAMLAVGCGGRAASDGGGSGANGSHSGDTGSASGGGGMTTGTGMSTGSVAVSGVVSTTGACAGGCLCFLTPPCPAGCYPAHDSTGAFFCSNGPPIGSACVTDSDCSGGLACAFEVAAGCSAKGTCQSEPLGTGGVCAPQPAACTCAGTTDLAPTCGFGGNGYAHEPIAYQGVCEETVVQSEGGAAGRVPVNHRPSDAQCSTSAAPGDCSPFPDAGCASDSDCTEAGTNGRCINQGGGAAAPCVCASDTCSVDTDCPNGQTCACHGAPYTDGHGNACVTGNCRVDADCGAEGYCSPSSRTLICGDSLAGYYCHTAVDLCIDDSDCASFPTHGVPGVAGCVYSTTNSRWECVAVPVCG